MSEDTESEERAVRVERRVTLAQAVACLGCGGIIVGSTLLAVFTAWDANRRFGLPEGGVAAVLQQVVRSTPPPGFRGLQAKRLRPDDPSPEQAIAVLAPEGYEGSQVAVDLPLTLYAARFRADLPADARLAATLRYWDDMVRKHLDADAELVSEDRATGIVRGAEVGGVERRYRGTALPAVGRPGGAKVEVKVVVLLAPRAAQGPPDDVALSACGAADRFDQGAWSAFLASVQ